MCTSISVSIQLGELPKLHVICFECCRLAPEDLEGNLINLKYVKYQNVQNIQLFIQDNQQGGDITQIDQLTIIGSPINTTNMGDFKRVTGTKGESH